MLSFCYVSLFRALRGMLNHHSFKFPNFPVFAISRVKAFLCKIKGTKVVAPSNKCLCGLSVKGAMPLNWGLRVRAPLEVTILKFLFLLFLSSTYAKTVLSDEIPVLAVPIQ